MGQEKLPQDARALKISELFKRWSDARRNWDDKARDDIDFYLGNHWTQEEIDELASRNQSSLSMDRLYSSIEQFKAIVTAKPPKFRVYAREDSDHKMSAVINTMLEYIWDISDGNEVFKQVVHDYAVTGLGYFHAFLDTEADYGRGEIKFSYIDPFRVYVDPNSRHRYFDDASGIVVSTILTKEQIVDMYDQLQEIPEGLEKPLIEYINSGIGETDEDYPSSNYNTEGTFTPAEIKDQDTGPGTEKYRMLTHYEKIKVPYFRVFDADAGVTGRKLVVDNYGPRVPIGGGAFSGKDSSKVDRSAAYMARRIAVDLLKDNDASEVYVYLAYAIGYDKPVQHSAIIDGKDVGVIGYDLSPNGIINTLGLQEPKFEKTAEWGHFGNEFTWG